MAKEYPLEQLAIIKKKKLEEAERMLREKKEKLLAEEEKLARIEKERDKIKTHKLEKLSQLRSGLDEGLRTDKIETMRLYLKTVEEKLKQHEKRVIVQQKEVEKAEDAVEVARLEMIKRQQNVEKLKEHKGLWQKEVKKELEKEEDKETDEIGSTRYVTRKRKKKSK